MFKKYFGNFKLKKSETWEIPDLHHLHLKGSSDESQADLEIFNATEKTFELIKSKVDELVTKLYSA
jgi:hypothetical protein